MNRHEDERIYKQTEILLFGLYKDYCTKREKQRKSLIWWFRRSSPPSEPLPKNKENRDIYGMEKRVMIN